jgi:hypothetical protein
MNDLPTKIDRTQSKSVRLGKASLMLDRFDAEGARHRDKSRRFSADCRANFVVVLSGVFVMLKQ